MVDLLQRWNMDSEVLLEEKMQRILTKISHSLVSHCWTNSCQGGSAVLLTAMLGFPENTSPFILLSQLYVHQVIGCSYKSFQCLPCSRNLETSEDPALISSLYQWVCKSSASLVMDDHPVKHWNSLRQWLLTHWMLLNPACFSHYLFDFVK